MSQQVCETCYGTDFELVDGLYFCVICQSQSQVVREVVADEEFQEDFRLNFATQIMDNTMAVGLASTENNKTVPLSEFAIVEIYTIILRKQVERLIELGFPKCLKDAALYIWIKFLKATGRAFCEKSPDSNAEGPAEDPASNSAEASTSNLVEDPKIEPRLASLNLHTTVSILYMAVLKCGLELFFYELYRLVSDGLLPFMNVYEKLPERYQQPIIKYHLETRIWMTLSCHYDDCALIAISIDEKFLLKLDIEETFSRMLFALNLPSALMPHIMHLYGISKIRAMKYLEAINRNDSNKLNVERKCPEMKCLAFIILALKLIFCIDDEREYILSKAAKEYDSENSFIFMLWLTQLKMRISVLKGEKVEEVLEDDELPGNISQSNYRLFYSDFTEKKFDFSNYDLRSKLPKKDDDEFMKEESDVMWDFEPMTVADQLFPCRKYYQFYRSTIRESSHIPLKLEHLRQEMFSKNFDDLISIFAYIVNDRPFSVYLSLLCIEQRVFKNWRYPD